MDHLDRPSGVNENILQIPYVCLEPYDNESFEGYPARRGYDQVLVTECDFRRTDPERGEVYGDMPAIQSFLQAWLFFGLLWETHRIAGLSFEQDDFVSQDVFVVSPIRRLNTSKLPERLLLWKDKFLNLSLEEADNQFRKFDACLEMAYKVCYRLWMSRDSLLNGYLLLSFMSLGNSLETAMRLIRGACLRKHLKKDEKEPAWQPGHRGWDAPPVLFQLMRHSGWCSFELNILRRDFEINEIIYASQLYRTGDRYRHRLCSPDACTANNIDEKTYETRHARGCVGCEHVVLDYRFICNTIREGHTPLIMSVKLENKIEFVMTSDKGLPPIQRVDGVVKKRYICISHVWSHGLGNARRNTLPRCQLELLHKYTSVVLTEGRQDMSIFWIDTICVPVLPEHRDLRSRTIARMASIYRDAIHVLVLDEGLMQSSFRADPSKPYTGPNDLIDQRELTFRLIFSDWWRRLWTLQEGVLPDTFFIVFGEGPMHFGEAAQARADDHFRNLAHASSPVVQNMLINLMDKQYEKNDIRFHRQVITLLSYRSTSRAEDEPVCLGTLMGVDVRPILEIPGSERSRRMRKLYNLLGKVPASLIFLPGRKLDVDGFRWAPDSLIAASGPGMRFLMVSEYDEGEGVITPQGLHLEAVGHRLASLGASLKFNFYIFPGDPGRLYEDDEAAQIFDGSMTPDRAVTAVAGNNLPSSQGDFEHIPEEELVDPVLIVTKNRRINVYQTHAIIASNPRLVGNRWHAKFLCVVHCYTNSMAMFSEKSDSVNSIRGRLRTERESVKHGKRTGYMAWKKDAEPITDWCIL